MNRLLYVLLVSALLVGCAEPYTRVEKPEYSAEGGAYKIDLPVGWVEAKFPYAHDTLKVSKDGYALQSIDIYFVPLSKAFEKLKKPATVTMLPSELADTQIAEIKAENPNPASVEVVSNNLSKIAGLEGFRLHIKYLNDKGLRFEAIVYGVATSNGYYRVSYTAPTLHYFQRDLAEFEKVVASFSVKS